MTITTKVDLRAARPFWAATPDISVETQALPGRRDYDVIIVVAVFPVRSLPGCWQAATVAFWSSTDDRQSMVRRWRAPP
ncbi:hypothetical protein ACU5AY_17225 [Rhizobium sp. PAMB 3174]